VVYISMEKTTADGAGSSVSVITATSTLLETRRWSRASFFVPLARLFAFHIKMLNLSAVPAGAGAALQPECPHLAGLIGGHVVGPLEVPEVHRGWCLQRGLYLLRVQRPRWWVRWCPDSQGWEILWQNCSRFCSSGAIFSCILTVSAS
jgi:hypothetical protein